MKVFASSIAVFASAAFDFLLFRRSLSLSTYLGGLLAGGATLVHFGDHKVLLEEDATFLRGRGKLLGFLSFSCILLFFFTELDDKHVGHKYVSRTFVEADMKSCDWPPPLYPSTPSLHTELFSSLAELRRQFVMHPETSFAYIDSGGVLGLYRDGNMVIPGDSDLDIQY